MGLYTITQIFSNTDYAIAYLTVGGELIETTPNHPFFTQERGWLFASQLLPGEHLQKRDGSYGTVEKLEIVSQEQVMYNLEVDVAHTFFVGKQQLLVHNKAMTEFIEDLKKERFVGSPGKGMMTFYTSPKTEFKYENWEECKEILYPIQQLGWKVYDLT